MSASSPVTSAPLHTIQRNNGESNGRYIVKFKDHATKDAFISRDGIPNMITHNWGTVIPGCTGTFDEATLDYLRRSPHVEYIEEDGIVKHCAPVIQTQSDAPWGLQRISQRDQVSDQGEEALTYDYTYKTNSGGAPVDIYIVDTGIRTTHEDFGDPSRASWGATFGGYQDADGNGHGTHCAGTAGGTQFGVAKGASLIAVKVLDDNGSGNISDVISGLNWVAGNVQSTTKASVVNMSLGGGPSHALDDAVNNASSLSSAPLILIVAAGNASDDAKNYSPPRAAEAIAVGASNIQDSMADFSNYGSVVALFAPGVNVVSAGIASDSDQATMSGTSMAAPHVSGLVAYWINVYGNATPSDMKTTLRTEATKDALSNIPSGTDNLLAYNDNDSADDSGSDSGSVNVNF